MRVYLDYLGCRLNAAESELIARHFAGSGCEVVDAPEAADLLVLNTCAVTAQASRRSRHLVRTLHRDHPEAEIVVTGCWAVAYPERIRRMPGVTQVIPNDDKLQIASHVLGESSAPIPWSPGWWGRTRANLGVQFGCDEHCTYCVTRRLRGPARSQPLEDVIRSVRTLVAQGAQEVVLTGVCLGAYGRDLDMEHGLATLVLRILDETSLPRLRLSSVEPWDVDAELLALLDHPRFCRHLHLPLQSGSDAVLRRMGRRIDRAAFADVVAAARAISPDLAITTDVIAGFPGEMEADFEATLDFVERRGFSRLHVFPYSEREGTPAAGLPEKVPARVKNARAGELRRLGKRLGAAYRARYAGERLPVLWQSRDSKGRWVGLTDTYLKVYARSDRDLHNRITSVRMPRKGWMVDAIGDFDRRS